MERSRRAPVACPNVIEELNLKAHKLLDDIEKAQKAAQGL